MSVGHVARLLEAAGMATVVIASRAFRLRLEAMRVPRLLVTPHVMGRPIGRPGDAPGHLRTMRAALALLERARAPEVDASLCEPFTALAATATP